MRRLIICCGLSIFLYVLAFPCVLNRPLSLGLLHLQIIQKTTRLASLSSPKIVILAGSNGPYSHSCVVMSAMLQLPCENAGIAVGIGLDELFARYSPLLHRGDIVYMPMELQQYSATRAQYRSGPDGGFLLRHDRAVLAQLPADRILGAVFCCNIADFLESLVEMPIASSGIINPEKLLASEYDIEGDRIDNPLNRANAALLSQTPPATSVRKIMQGYGAVLIGRFVRAESARGVIVIGGLPTQVATASLSSAIIRAITHIYTRNNGTFIALPNHGLYAVRDFFNGPYHLVQPCQYLNSIAVSYLLGAQLNRPVQPPGNLVLEMARTCPVAPARTPAFYAINAAR